MDNTALANVDTEAQRLSSEGRMERDIIERLMDFERCGFTAWDRVNMRESAAVEIHRLRQQNEKYRKTLEVIAGSSDKLQATQALGALDNIGATV